MSDRERKFDFPAVEAIEKVVPSAGQRPFVFPEISIIKAPYIDSTAITTNRDVIIGQDAERNVPVRIGERQPGESWNKSDASVRY